MAHYKYTRSKGNYQSTGNDDVLGDEGRQALDACVKVKIYGRPETRKYDYGQVHQRVRKCYVSTLRLDSLLSKEFPPPDRDEHGKLQEKTYNDVDIYNAVVKFDTMSYVEKYPKDVSGSHAIKASIDKRRASIERELEKAVCCPGEKHQYSFSVAQRRLRECFAGNFPTDGKSSVLCGFDSDRYNIKEIQTIVDCHDKHILESSKERDSSEEDCKKALYEPPIRNYIVSQYLHCLETCHSTANLEKLTSLGFPSSDIFESHDALCNCGYRMRQLYKYPEDGPGSEELKRLIDKHRADLKEESENFQESKLSLARSRTYSRAEAERRVRDCFAGSFPGDIDIFPTKKDKSGMQNISKTFDISDIKKSLDYFDAKLLLEKYPENGDVPDEEKQLVDNHRASIEDCQKATSIVEIEHGSGFIIHDHFIITNKHVIETCLDDEDKHEIHISNAAIGDVSCKVAHYDPSKDLALLYCPNINLKQSCICPFQLSSQPLLPGMQIYSFGYPLSHTGETALLMTGNVSGSKETLSGHRMAVLNCSLNSGNSGGPVLSWVDDQLKVVGIATQKHFKEILSLDERMMIEKIRESMQTCAIQVTDREKELVVLSKSNLFYIASYQISMHLLTLKLYDALETHSQFNLGNALPGQMVVDFIKDSIIKVSGESECKEELKTLCKEYDVCN